MSVTLETHHVSGSTVVAAVIRKAVDVRHSCCLVAVTGDLRPLAVLVRVGDRVTGFTPSGDPLTDSQLQEQYPEAIAQLMSADSP